MLDMLQELDRIGSKDFSSSFVAHLRLVTADDFAESDHRYHPRVVFSCTVLPEHCNRLGNMHGGATATLLDLCTSLALSLKPGGADAIGEHDGVANSGESHQGNEEGIGNDNDNVDDNDDDDGDVNDISSWRLLGVSRTLAVTYVRPAPSGTDVLIECEVVHAGRRLSSLRGILRRRSDGAVLATCEHGKVITDPPAPPSKL
ncbi:thioesterase family protein [Niveomyces insectorum RCEF 264]|uniref:Thioesterase family protein n=1 Tax=Niveomyces insectorum RCEF 264 TaxID=1081102 RepID=A0A168A8W9_9HYPO|nr:thioesterase family protein [Niveomyces insectorum RCEF 264]